MSKKLDIAKLNAKFKVPGMASPPGGARGIGGGGFKPMSLIMFEKFDTDNSGQIDSKEFHQLCFAMGYALTEEEGKFAFRSLDADNSGELDKDEFAAWWKQKDRFAVLKLDEASLKLRQEAADVFNEFDSTKSGQITTADFDKFYAHLKEKKLTTKTKEKCLAELDSNGDKNIQFGEYIQWLTEGEAPPIKVAALSGIGPEVAKKSQEKGLGK